MVHEKFQKTENNKWWLLLPLLSSGEKCYLFLSSSPGVLGVASRERTDERGLALLYSWATMDQGKS